MKSHDYHKRSSFSISVQDGATTSHDHYTQALRLNFVSSLLMITRPTLTLTSFIVSNKKHIKHILIAPSNTKLRLHALPCILLHYLKLISPPRKKQPCLRYTGVPGNDSNDNLLSLDDLKHELRFSLQHSQLVSVHKSSYMQTNGHGTVSPGSFTFLTSLTPFYSEVLGCLTSRKFLIVFCYDHP